MRNGMFYPRLASQGLRKNGKFYLPYLLTCVFTAAVFYILLYLATNEGLKAMRGTVYIESTMIMGSIIVALFSVVVLLYANSFLMKRRQKELGLYNILGMKKSNIGRILLWETLYSAVIMIVVGLALGIALSKLILLLLCAILQYDAQFGFDVSMTGVWGTIIISGAILLFNLLSNLRRVGMSKPIELLRAGSVSDREPKTKWPIAVIGLITLSAGYILANRVITPIEALGAFIPAVALVMMGTYGLFGAGSVALLKLLRKNKAYYYKTERFITVSGMIHRMNRNAVGLGSICILCTMVLVTVSATLSLYLGAEDSLNRMYPSDITVVYEDGDEASLEKTLAAIDEQTEKLGVTAENVTVNKEMEFSAKVAGDAIILRESGYNIEEKDSLFVHIIPASRYENATGKQTSLGDSDILAQMYMNVWQLPDKLTLLNKAYNVTRIDNFPIEGNVSTYVAQLCLIVASDDELPAIRERFREQSVGKALYYDGTLDLLVGFDVSGISPEAQMDLSARLRNALQEQSLIKSGNATVKHDRVSTESRAIGKADFMTMYGGFFFIGIFLGLVFLAATVLIIYYKQLSEGYEDAGRFKIMQQVGMSEKLVRKSVKTQVLTVFFLPLVMAGLHIIAAFYLIAMLLQIFNLFNGGLFIRCCAGTFAAFALVYALIYAVTAKSYYQIVKS